MFQIGIGHDSLTSEARCFLAELVEGGYLGRTAVPPAKALSCTVGSHWRDKAGPIKDAGVFV